MKVRALITFTGVESMIAGGERDIPASLANVLAACRYVEKIGEKTNGKRKSKGTKTRRSA